MIASRFDRIDPAVPQGAVNAAIVAAMRDEAYDPDTVVRRAQWGLDPDGYAYCDMTPVVRDARRIDEPRYTGPDVWLVAVQYSTKGMRALYGITANHVPTLYQD